MGFQLPFLRQNIKTVSISSNLSIFLTFSGEILMCGHLPLGPQNVTVQTPTLSLDDVLDVSANEFGFFILTK